MRLDGGCPPPPDKPHWHLRLLLSPEALQPQRLTVLAAEEAARPDEPERQTSEAVNISAPSGRGILCMITCVVNDITFVFET